MANITLLAMELMFRSDRWFYLPEYSGVIALLEGKVYLQEAIDVSSAEITLREAAEEEAAKILFQVADLDNRLAC